VSHEPRIASNRSVFGLLARAVCAVILIGGGCGRTNDGGQSLTGPSNAIAIATSNLASGTVGTPYSATLQATGGTGNYTWSVVSGSTPAGLTLSSGGVLSGTPSTVATSGFTAQVTSGSASATQAFSVTIVVASVPTLSITTTSLAEGTVGTTYNQTLQATGGTGTFSWSVVSGSLPTGLALSPVGALSGTPSSAGAFNFTVQATSGTQAATQALTVTVTAAVSPLSITTASLSGGTVGTSYTVTLQATGGTGSYTWSVASGTLPAGFVLSSAGVLSGTATSAATSNFTVQVTSGGAIATQALSVTMSLAPLAITSTTVPTAIVGVAYADTLKVIGGTGVYTWSLVSGSLPGLTLFGDGIISGTAVSSGSYVIVVQVTSGTQTANQTINVTITASASLAITTKSLTGGIVGAAYTQTLQATGNTGSYAWSVVSGPLPTGLTLSSGGVLSGTPTTATISNFTVQVTSGSTSATQALQLTIVAAGSLPVSITTATLPSATVGAAYAQTLQATGGTGSYAWNVTSGSLPTGITLSSVGLLSGTPTTAAPNNFTVQVTSGSSTATQAFSVSVVAASGVASQLVLIRRAEPGVPSGEFVTQPVVAVQDAAGNTVVGSTALVELSYSLGSSSSVGQGGAGGAYAVNGVASFTNAGRAMAAPGTYTLTFSSTGLTSATQTYTQIAVDSMTVCYNQGACGQLAIEVGFPYTLRATAYGGGRDISQFCVFQWTDYSPSSGAITIVPSTDANHRDAVVTRVSGGIAKVLVHCGDAAGTFFYP
jgi:hypothetical protein